MKILWIVLTFPICVVLEMQGTSSWVTGIVIALPLGFIEYVRARRDQAAKRAANEHA